MTTAIEYGLVAALVTVVVVTGVTAANVDVGLEAKPPFVLISHPKRPPPAKEFVGWRCPPNTVAIKAEGDNYQFACVPGTPATPVYR